MRRITLPLFAVFFLLNPARNLIPQDAGPEHAPDFRAQQKLAPLYFSSKSRAPFMAIAKTVWVQTLPDGSTVTRQNERVVTRDMDGRIFQERRTFIPVPDDGKQQSVAYVNEYSDPVAHTMYSCFPGPKICNLATYFGLLNEASVPVGLQRDGISFLTRENLGVDTIEGLPVQRSRETFTFFKEKIGNTKTILRVVDYWYSPALGVNVKVVRHDPRDGDQTLWLTNISATAADPSTFQVPADFRIYDRRIAKPTFGGQAPAQ
ncbi:MAG TPA: hypothetical protein VH308_12825 [Terracidiphilus sp.]|nr:hypothetical protein [Terracidiphilus sp.]